MPWSFRKSLTLGPFRINFSKSGISYSFGMFGFRTGVNAKGRRYNSYSIPGTGISYKSTPKSDKSKSKKKKGES